LSRTRIILATAAVLALAVTLAPQSAWAPVPPRDCGMLRAEGKRFNIKADQIRCSTARRQAKRYLVSGREPSGYSCRDYGRGTKIQFRCSKGQRVVFAIRR
jgi:hypothetical protein